VASLTFGGVILVVGIVALFFALLGSAGYFTTSKIYSFITGKELKDLFRFLPLFGTFFDKDEEENLNNTLSPSSSSSPGSASSFKFANGRSPPMQILPYSDEEEEEDEGNVEVVDSENDETDDNSVASSDAGIADTSISIENGENEQDFQSQIIDKTVKATDNIVKQAPITNGNHHEEETQ
jgi:hypothetical protein